MSAEAPKQEYLKHRGWLAIPVFLVLGITLPFVVGFFVSFDTFATEVLEDSSTNFTSGSVVLSSALPGEVVEESGVYHVPLPEEVRGIYWTGVTAGGLRGENLLEYMLATGLNSVVIDAKMDNGELAFVPNNESLKPYVMLNPAIDDLDRLLERLGEAGIYRIGRVAVMRDGAFAYEHPEFAMRSGSGGFWYDSIGSIWVDPAATEVADYAVALGEELYARGFDEIQYDYVRFASDGAVSAIVYPVYDKIEEKIDVMQRFFKAVGGTLREQEIPVSFDLFGMTFFSHYDYNIGQRLVDALPYSDWVSPMVYPSHYPNGFDGYANPAVNPYEIVKLSLDEGARIMLPLWSGAEESLRTKWRPWLQDFDIGAVYTSGLIEAQIQASRDAGASGWILWNARNVYEPAEYVETVEEIAN